MVTSTPAYAQPARATLLRRVLQADALAVALSGALLALGAGTLAGPLGIPSQLLLGLGIALLPYAALIWYIATRPSISRRAVWGLIIFNALWVVDSLVLLASGVLPLTQAGWWFVLVQAIIVAGFAELEFVGLRRTTR